MMKLLVVARGMHAANTTLAFRRMSAISVSFFPIWATLFAAPLRPTNQLLQLARLEFEFELAALARQQPPPRRFPFASLVSVVARPRPRKPSCSVSLDTGNHLWLETNRQSYEKGREEGEPTRTSRSGREAGGGERARVFQVFALYLGCNGTIRVGIVVPSIT